MPNPTDTLYAPPLPPLGKPPVDFFDYPQPQTASKPSLDGYAAHLEKLTPPKRAVVRTIGEDEVRGELLRTIVNMPRRVNPRDVGGGCVNTSPIKNNHHCVAAQVVKNLGLPLPSTNCNENGGGAPTLSEWLRREHGVSFSPDAVELLQTAQAAADGDSSALEPEGWLLAVGRTLTRRRSY